MGLAKVGPMHDKDKESKVFHSQVTIFKNLPYPVVIAIAGVISSDILKIHPYC